MHQLYRILWFSLLLVSCKHGIDKPIPQHIQINLTHSICYEGDTVAIQVWVNEVLYTGTIHWNTIHINHSHDHYQFIAPTITTDSVLVSLTAQLENQTVTQSISIRKEALRHPLISYAQTIQPLLTNNCNFSGCHGNGSRAGKIELSVYDSAKHYVAPFNASSSLLYIALVKTDPLRVMPPAGQLHDYKIEEVRLWIEQGAQKN
jgi:hypothetical protein